MPGKQFTDLTKVSVLKDSDIFAVHDGNGLKKSSMGDVTTYMSDKFSNPNLLINPDFKINQRGESAYSSTKTVYTVDRWAISNAKVSVNSDSSVTASSLDSIGYFKQHVESISYGKHTYSIYVQAITGTVRAFYVNKDSKDVELGTLKLGLNTFVSADDGFKTLFMHIADDSSVTLKYAKVEQGTVATHFVAPNLADELVKCKRFTQYYDSIPCIPGVLFVSNTTVATSGWLPLYQILSPSMRVDPTISAGSVTANNGSSISGKYSVNSDKNRLKSVVFNEANNYHTITINRVLLDAEIY